MDRKTKTAATYWEYVCKLVTDLQSWGSLRWHLGIFFRLISLGLRQRLKKVGDTKPIQRCKNYFLLISNALVCFQPLKITSSPTFHGGQPFLAGHRVHQVVGQIDPVLIFSRDVMHQNHKL